jgi:hypothetical protein
MPLRRIFRLKMDEMIRGWRCPHNEELHDLYSSPNIIRMRKSRRMRSGHVTRTGEEETHRAFWWESQNRLLGKPRSR